MKKLLLYIFLAFYVLLNFSGCVSLEYKTLVGSQREEIKPIGVVRESFTSFQIFHFPIGVKQAAYKKLLMQAREKYSGDIDVVNIVIEGEGHLINMFTSLPGALAMVIGGIGSLAIAPSPGDSTPWLYTLGSGAAWLLLGNFQDVTAKGQVIQLTDPVKELLGKNEVSEKNTYSFSVNQLKKVIRRSYKKLSSGIPEGSTIAVVNIDTPNFSDGETLIEELTTRLVEKFRIVDRKNFDVIQGEYTFQDSAYVDQDTVVEMGKMAGATIVITGSIITKDKTSTLHLKALNVETAVIVAKSSEEIR